MFDWNKYLLLADELSKRTEEESQRSAISRAYYAVYCIARNWVKDNGSTLPSTTESNSHKKLWSFFKERDEPEAKKIGLTGDRLRRKRNDADYQDAIPNIKNKAITSIIEAKEIKEKLASLGKPSATSHVVEEASSPE